MLVLLKCKYYNTPTSNEGDRIMAKQKYYVVWNGRKPGIYTSWTECQAQVNQYPNAKFKSFESKELAEQAFKEGKQLNSKTNKLKTVCNTTSEVIDYNTISVDVGTSGNPGPVEYKGVDTKTGEVIFSVGPISKGTNNLGEFLAIVHALAYIKQMNSNKNIYSDSVNAINWVKQKKVSSTLVRDSSTEKIWSMVDRAVLWLENNTYDTKIMKWETKQWGEIKADYGRK